MSNYFRGSEKKRGDEVINGLRDVKNVKTHFVVPSADFLNLCEHKSHKYLHNWLKEFITSPNAQQLGNREYVLEHRSTFQTVKMHYMAY